MIAILEVIVLGIVEGITEWLPVSSTGHMLLVYKLFGINEADPFWSLFLVVIQFGAILAVVVIFWNKLWPFHRVHPEENGIYKVISRPKLVMWIKIIISCLPAIIVAMPLDNWIEAHFYNYVCVAIMLILWGVLFIVVENRNKGKQADVRKISEITWQLALIVGLFQLLSGLFPGTSRSGATILGGIMFGMSRKCASEYTFFLAVPVMLGASILKFVKFDGTFTGAQWGYLILGMVVAFIVSICAIRFLMGYIRKHDFKAFGWYRIVLGIIVLASFGIPALLA
ncbi:MAG: undecaprenyl-diphosphate phosphatase [Eubacteriales bacterium]|jgi:undecaprenyl-diphosphatase